MTAPTMPLDNLMHCAGCGNRMNAAPPDASAYSCTGCGTRINALNVNRTLIRHIMADVVTAEMAAEMQEPVQDLFEEQFRQQLPGAEPPDMSAERIHHYALEPDTYIGGDAYDAARLMKILVERIDADHRKAVITYRTTDLSAAAGSARTVNLQPFLQR